MRCLIVWALALAACAGAPPSGARRAAAAAAVSELAAGRFDQATAAAGLVLQRDPGNATAAAVRAFGRYQAAMHQMWLDIMTVGEGAMRGRINHEYMRTAMAKTVEALDAVDRDLEVAAADDEFALELCLACWQHDWNRNGRIDEGDVRLLQIEVDANGNEIPDGDPRRRPTFRFDTGDIHWARAMIAFQRALLDILLGYRWGDLDVLLFGQQPDKLTIRVGDASRLRRARDLIVAGAEHADRARRAYLAETDDDREWVPNPRQKSHPLPLVVDEALYHTWEGVLADVRGLLLGHTALDVAELAQLGDHRWARPPRGFIDIGRMLADPHDIVFDFAVLKRVDEDDPASVEAALKSVLGAGYVTKQQRSPLPARLLRMKREVDTSEDTFERKLRYFLWLN